MKNGNVVLVLFNIFNKSKHNEIDRSYLCRCPRYGQSNVS
jgi:hypothetical protein